MPGGGGRALGPDAGRAVACCSCVAATLKRTYDARVRLREQQVYGAEYLDCVTLLLQRARQASLACGLWEAAAR
jgi:hypothetical protein